MARQSQPASIRFHDLIIDVPFSAVRRTRPIRAC